MKSKRLNDYPIQSNRPTTPLVVVSLDDSLAVKRLIQHTSKRVIKEHKEALERLAYR